MPSGFRTFLRLLGFGSVTATPPVAVKINGTDYYDYLATSTLRWTEYEGGQTGAMSLDLEDVHNALTISEWQEVIVQLEGVTHWGGYIVRATPSLTAGGGRLWSLQCESWDTLLNRAPIVRQSWADATPATIIANLFTAAGLSDFDAVTEVDNTLPALGTFSTNAEKMTDVLDRLAVLAGVNWNISPSKAVVFKADGDLDTAPYSVVPLGDANWTTSYPPSGNPSPDIDATDIRNRVTVYGGVVPSSVYTDSFTGDGVMTRFTLDHAPVHDIVRVTVDGVVQWHGYDYYDTNFNDYDCLVDYTLGTVRWLDPPTNGADIEVLYRYENLLSTVRTSSASYTQYGRYFDFELRDASLTTEDACIAAGDAILAEYAFGVVGASFEMEYWGPRAGQQIQVEFPTLSLSGYYVIRQATIEIERQTRTALVSLKVGGRSARLSRVIGGSRGTGGLVGAGTTNPGQPNGNLAGEVDLLRVRDRIEIIDHGTTFVSATDYGDATGIVVLYESAAQAGKILGLNGGVLQSYFDSDGTIKWDGGKGTLKAGGLYMGDTTTFGDEGVQIEYNSGSPRLYIGNGAGEFIQFTGGNVGVGGAIYATSGYFSGSVYVGTSNPRIHLDGVNKRIESTNFASGTSGFRIEGTDGSAEFNNITARGAIQASVFTYGYIQATAGELIVAKGAGRLYANAVTAASFNIDVEDPDGTSHATAGTLWTVGDILRLKDPLVGDDWATISSKTDMTTYWRLTCTLSSGSNGHTYTAGATTVNYGVSGQGVIRLKADGSYAPYASIATHAGSPWSTMTERARMGNLDGVSGASGYGLWTDNGFFTGEVVASSGTIGGWTIASGHLYSGSGANTTGLKPADYPFYAGNATPGSAPFRVTPAGVLFASSGTVGGWTLATTKLYHENLGTGAGIGMATADDASGYAFWAGNTSPASAPFRVGEWGNLVATNATITGAVTASSGSIGGWTIDTGHLYSGSGASRAGLKPADYPFYAGSETQASAPFRVTTAGALTASNATITGAITASSGSITGTLSMGASGKVSGNRYLLDYSGLVLDTADGSYIQWKQNLTGTTELYFGITGGAGIMQAAATTNLSIQAGSSANLNLQGSSVTIQATTPGSTVEISNGDLVIKDALDHDGTTVGFYGVAPATRPAAYTFTNGTADRTIDCNASSTAELADVIYTMWNDLKTLGLLQ